MTGHAPLTCARGLAVAAALALWLHLAPARAHPGSGPAATAPLSDGRSQARPTSGPAGRPHRGTPPAAAVDARTAQVLVQCFHLAARRYGMSPLLLQAIARQESSMNPRALNRNGNGSADIGLMQINSSWFPVLARHGIKPQDLWEPCTNIMVGAWILGDNMARMGPTVGALGAYNARDPVKQERYARQVLRHLAYLDAGGR